MKTKKYADGGLAGIADTANNLMSSVSDMANTINYGSGNTGGATNPLGFNAVTGQSPAFKKGGKVKSASARADGIAVRGKTRA